MERSDERGPLIEVSLSGCFRVAKLSQEMLRSGFYNIAGAVFRTGISVLTVPLFIRFLGIADYGLLSMILAVIGVAGLAEMGLSTSTTVLISRDLAKSDKAGAAQTLSLSLALAFVLATFAALVLAFSAKPLLNWLPALEDHQRPVVVKAIQVSGLVLWSSLLQQILIGLEQAYHRYGLINILSTLQAIISSGGMLLVAYKGGGQVRLMQWLAIANLCFLVVHFVAARRIFGAPLWSPRFDRAKLRELAGYSSMAWLTSLGPIMFSQVDRLIVGSLLGMGVLGVYSAITTITTKINQLSALPVQPLLPTLTGLINRRDIDHDTVIKRAGQALRMNALVAVGIGTTLFLCADLVVHFIFPGIDAAQFGSMFRLAVVIYTLYSLNAAGYNVMFATNSLKACFAVQFLSAASALALIALGAKLSGLPGAIAGNAGYLGVWFLTVLGMKKLNISYSTWMNWLRFPVALFIAASAVGLLAPMDYSFGVGAAVLASFFLLRWFLVAEKTAIRDVFRKLLVSAP
jgi:O-antigen/teichoic acid export membrane protein